MKKSSNIKRGYDYVRKLYTWGSFSLPRGIRQRKEKQGKMATVRKRGKGYEIRVYCGLGVNYGRKDKSMTWIPEPGMTPRQIEKALEKVKFQFEQEVLNGTYLNSSMTFAQFVEVWREDYAKEHLAIKTYARYEGFLKRILPALGHIKLNNLNVNHLHRFYKNLGEKGINLKTRKDKNGKPIGDAKLSPKTIYEHHRLISEILNKAVRWGMLDVNVASRATPPKVPHTEISILDDEQVKMLVAALNKEAIQHRAMILLLLYTGMRRGELCGLEWKDIDFETQMLRICRSSQYVGNRKLITKEPKTRSGIREFMLSSSACTLLKEYRQWQDEQKKLIGDEWQETDRLFTQWNGLPIYPDTVTKWFARFIERNNFPHVTLHSLRHTNASLMIAEGVDVCTVSKRLGHANTSTTLNIYTHAIPSKDTEAAERLEQALSI